MERVSDFKKSNLAKLNKFIFFLILLVILSGKVLAYVDPGTGGMVVGSVWHIFLAVLGAVAALFVKIFYKPIKNKILKFRKKGGLCK